MRILVFSDTHGRRDVIRRAFSEQGAAELVLHLGDGIRDLEEIPKGKAARVIFVPGNCDFAAGYEQTKVVEFFNRRIFMAHGHTFGVKRGLTALAAETRARGADIGLFGHTHIPFNGRVCGVSLLNPGAGGYAVIEIDEGNLRARLF